MLIFSFKKKEKKNNAVIYDIYLNTLFLSAAFVILVVLRRSMTSGGLAPGQHSSEETSQRWRVSNLTDPGVEPQTSCIDRSALAN